jgi:hypothetical protein
MTNEGGTLRCTIGPVEDIYHGFNQKAVLRQRFGGSEHKAM